MLKIMGSILVFAAAAGMAGTYKRELADHLALLYAAAETSGGSFLLRKWNQTAGGSSAGMLCENAG